MRDKDKKRDQGPKEDKGIRNAENPQTQSPTPGNLPNSPIEKKGGRTPAQKEFVTGTDDDGQVTNDREP